MTTGSADLHVHSSASDGTDPPERVVARAREADLAAIALTDHDTTEGLEEAMAAGARLGVEVIAGIEMSAEHAGREVHLLGYFFDPRDRALTETLEDLLAERSRRIERMVARLNELGAEITLDDVRASARGRSIGRPHVADALVAGRQVPSYEAAWSEYLKPGGKAYVERRRLPLPEADDLIRRAGGITSIAHPTLNLSLAELEDAVLTVGFDALETRHPRVTADESAALAALCHRHGLAETAGSDCHGHRRGGPFLGSVTTAPDAIALLRARAFER